MERLKQPPCGRKSLTTRRGRPHTDLTGWDALSVGSKTSRAWYAIWFVPSFTLGDRLGWRQAEGGSLLGSHFRADGATVPRRQSGPDTPGHRSLSSAQPGAKVRAARQCDDTARTSILVERCPPHLFGTIETGDWREAPNDRHEAKGLEAARACAPRSRR